MKLKSWEGFLVCALALIIAMNVAVAPEFLTFSNQTHSSAARASSVRPRSINTPVSALSMAASR